VSSAAITLCVASQLVFIVDVYFVIDSVRKLFDTPSYTHGEMINGHKILVGISGKDICHLGRLGYFAYLIQLDVHLLQT
jgi:hypothetical protein